MTKQNMNCLEHQRTLHQVGGLGYNILISFRIVTVVFFCLSFLVLPYQVVGHGSIPRLLLVSMDGFRWDYLNIAHDKWNLKTPNFDQLIANGSTINNGGMFNVYVTKTKVNHYSIATGLYAEEHGVVGNHMYDPKTGKRLFKHPDEMDPVWFDNGTDLEHAPEPIWVTNEKAPSTSLFTRRSGTYLWPASYVKINNRHPYKYVDYEKDIFYTGYKERIERMVEWFVAKEAINLGLLHIPEPDHTGHYSGPDSKNMQKTLVMLDGLLGHLIRRLRENHLYDHINLIVTSDHGMTKVYPDKQQINFTQYVAASDARAVGQETVINVFPVKGKEQEVYNKLRNISHTTTYWKQDIPDELHYKYNTRIAPIIIEADPGWQIVTNETGDYIDKIHGTHGYTNKNPDMHPIFIAHGPAFKRGYKIKQFNTVDLYPLMCHLLHIKPARNSGSLENVRNMLVEEEEEEEHGFFSITALTFIVAVLFTSTVAGVFAIAACRTHRIIRKRPLRISLQTLEDTTNYANDGKTKLLDDYDEEDEFS